jgi:AraC-like DNA-binding protein
LKNPLKYTNHDISAALGYQDTQNFCRTFHKQFGLSPGKYRRRQEQ